MLLTTSQSKARIAGGRRSFAGFTMIEVTMAVALMAITFVSIFGIMTVCFFICGTTRENLRATQIMLDKMEGLRLFSPTQLTNTTMLVPSFTNYFCETNNIGLPTVQGYGVQYNGTISVTNVNFSTTYSTNMYQVTVTLNWISGGQGNLAHTRSMSCYYASQGLYNYVWSIP